MKDNVNVRLDIFFKKKLLRHVARKGLSLSQWVRKVLERAYRERK